MKLGQNKKHCEEGRAEEDRPRGRRLLEERKLTVKQAAQKIGVGQTVLRRLIKQGAIPILHIEGMTLILEDDLEQFLANRYVRVNSQDLDEDGLPLLPEEVRNSPYL